MVVNLAEVKRAAELGYSVIPLHKTKKPCLLSWKEHQERRASAEEIEGWDMAHRPELWGIVTGEVSKTIILDFDGQKGIELLEKLELKPHIRTGSGGWHTYFDHPGWRVKTLNSKSKRELGERWPGLDIRADGGYAAFHGENLQGPYEVYRDLADREALEKIPPALKAFLGLDRSEDPDPVRSGTLPDDRGRVRPGVLIRKALAMVMAGEGRNNAGFWLAVQLRDNGYSESEAVDVGRFEYVPHIPPLNARGAPEPYNDREWQSSVSQAFTRPAREPWTRATNDQPDYPKEPDGEPEERGKPSRFKLYTTDEVLKLPPPEWLIDRILPTKAMACLFGAPGAGKSFVVLDMMMSISCGIPWLERETRHGAAVYVVGEGSAGLSKRLAAWKSRFPDDPETDPIRRLYTSLSMPHILNGEMGELMKSIESLPEFPVLIAIDTLARAMAGGDENSAKDMGRLIDGCEYVRERTGASVLLVHHTGKGGDIRGSSALMGALETCISLANDGGSLVLHCDKQKDGEPFDDIYCKLSPVTVGERTPYCGNNELAKSCVVVQECKAKTPSVQGSLAQTFRALQSCATENGLSGAEWKELCGQPTRTYYHNRKQLVQQGYVGENGKGYTARYVVRNQ